MMPLWWLYGGYVFPVVVRPELFLIKFEIEGQGKMATQKQCGSWPMYYAPLVQTWWTQLERVMSYGAGKLKMGLILTLKLNFTLKVNTNFTAKP